MQTTTEYRLTDWDQGRLAAASKDLYDSWAAEKRVDFYLRRGYCLADSIEYAIVWALNMAEQAARRVAHDTGAEGWRRRGSWEVVE